MKIVSLSKFFKLKMQRNPDATAEGVLNLRRFACQFGSEVQLDEINRSVRFCSGPYMFTIRCDLDNNKLVYNGFVKTFGPEETVAYTDYMSKISKVLRSLHKQMEAVKKTDRKKHKSA